MTQLLSLLVLLSAASALAKDVDFIRKPQHSDPCVNDVFFADLPLEVPSDGVPPNLPDALAAQLTGLASDNPSWFCDQNCAHLSRPGRLAAKVVQLLEPDRGDDFAKRFLRIAFYYRPEADGPDAWANAQRLAVRDDATCHAVGAIESTMRKVAGRGFFVGRACTASGQQAANPVLGDLFRHRKIKPSEDADLSALLPFISQEMLNWHLERMEVDGPRNSDAAILLMDTGVRDDIVDGVRRVDPLPELLPARYDGNGQPRQPVEPVSHPHGTEMAVLMRQITTARIFDLPILGHVGRVPLGLIARNLDSASARLGGEPLVVNLSLGWAPEIERERKLRRGDCIVLEAPAGEAMRAVLARIRARQPSTLVVAAAGNRPGLGQNYDAGFSQRLDASPRRAGGTDNEAFYPGHWGLRDADIAAASQPLLLSVGATQSTGTPAALDMRKAHLYAPGQHVFAVAEGDDALGCGLAGNQLIDFPRAISGSSASAAFTAALATRVYDRVRNIDAQDVARLLYLSGVPVPVEIRGQPGAHVGLDDVQARQINARQLDRLLDDPARVLRDCGGAGGRFTGGEIRWPCSEILTRHDIPLTASRPAAPVTPLRSRPLECTPSVDASRLSLITSEREICLDRDAPAACFVADLYSAGDAGPTPESDPCPTCGALVRLNDGRLDLYGMLSQILPADTVMEHPWFLAYWDDGFSAKVDLDRLGADQLWQPGKELDLKGIDLGDLRGHDLTKANVFLSLQVKTPDQTTASTSLSVLWVSTQDD